MDGKETAALHRTKSRHTIQPCCFSGRAFEKPATEQPVSRTIRMPFYLETKFEIILPLNVEEFRERLESSVDKVGFRNFLRRSKANRFLGEVNDFAFKIYKKIDYRNGSLPEMHGNFEPCGERTRVRVSMRPDKTVYTFVTAWTIGTLGGLVISLSLCGISTLYNLIYIGLFILGTGLAYWGFWSEVDSSKRLILRLFE
jgi:hypothetical protein